MYPETLDVEFYRERAHLCRELANLATASKPLFARLYCLARAYEERAAAAESNATNRSASQAERGKECH
jgi:hypothetical protein